MKSAGYCVIAVLAVAARPVATEAKPEWREGLSDRQLAIQRWFSYLTIRSKRSAKPWPEWFDNGKELDVTSMRYQLAFCGYGCAAMADETPAYNDLIRRQLRDLCERMIDVRIWYYVTKYWDYKDGPPDPCRYENVMYTGHLTQLMCLYELMSGDKRYSTRGWDFVWRDGRKIHYTLEKAIRRMHVQSVANRCGGISCEPGLVFADCNSHSANSFLLFDLLHGTSYAKINDKWFKWMSHYFRNRLPGADTYLFAIYNSKNDTFVPVGDPGADGWALGYGYPWFPNTEFVASGWRYLIAHGKWHHPKPDQMYAQINPLVGCCGGSKPGIANSFLPLVAVQVEGAGSKVGGKVLNWLDAKFGRQVDTNGDGQEDSYYYHTCDAHRIPATGNIAAALATDGDSMRRLYRTPRKNILDGPMLAHVDYPNVCVRTAEYVAPVLRFTVLKGRPGFAGKTTLLCKNIRRCKKVTRDGRPFTDFKQTSLRLKIRTDVKREHVFEITVVP